MVVVGDDEFFEHHNQIIKNSIMTVMSSTNKSKLESFAKNLELWACEIREKQNLNIFAVSNSDAYQSLYELRINIKKAVVVGGGLPNLCFTEVFFDEQLYCSTEIVQPPLEWNKSIMKKWSNLGGFQPKTFSFRVFKKKWTASGYKMVGHVDFTVDEFLILANKPLMEKEYALISNKRHLTLSGSILLGIELIEIKMPIIKQIITNDEDKKSTDNIVVEDIKNTKDAIDLQKNKSLIYYIIPNFAISVELYNVEYKINKKFVTKIIKKTFLFVKKYKYLFIFIFVLYYIFIQFFNNLNILNNRINNLTENSKILNNSFIFLLSDSNITIE
jgi:hypothetical protein